MQFSRYAVIDFTNCLLFVVIIVKEAFSAVFVLSPLTISFSPQPLPFLPIALIEFLYTCVCTKYNISRLGYHIKDKLSGISVM